jgi:hypothetical protein
MAGETKAFAKFGGVAAERGTDAAAIGLRDRVLFVGLVAVAHTFTYFVAGALAFTLLTHGLYEGADPLFGSYLRTPGEPGLWQHVTTWFLPAQVLRGALLGLALNPFLSVLLGWSAWRRALAIAGLYLVIGFWAAAVAAPGNIEGLVYLRPEFSPDVVLLVQPEIIVQGLAMSAVVALGIGRLLGSGWEWLRR